MNAVIKSADAACDGTVRAVPPRESANTTQAAKIEAREDRLERRIAELEAQLAVLKEDAAALEVEAKASFARGEAAGRDQGRRLAEDREEERVALLVESIAASRKEFAEGLAATEHLAILLAVECLDKLFADDTSNAERVRALLRAQMMRFERDQLVKVVVSAADFNEDTIAGLRTVVASDTVEIWRDPGLPPGGCKLIPGLGEIDIGLGTQWQTIRGLLLEMAAGEAPEC